MKQLLKWSVLVLALAFLGSAACLLAAPAPPPRLTLEEVEIPSAAELIQALWELLMPCVE